MERNDEKGSHETYTHITLFGDVLGMSPRVNPWQTLAEVDLC